MAVIIQTLKLGGRDDVTLGEALEGHEKFHKNSFANPQSDVGADKSEERSDKSIFQGKRIPSG